MNWTKHVGSLPVTFSDAGSTPAASTTLQVTGLWSMVAGNDSRVASQQLEL
jgi:hypothetical protein